ncbi:MAG: pseudouridine synthase, partial [Deltaproteobacteria bacterium]
MTAAVRLQRYLAAAGVAARRKAEELITAGRVTVNGAVVTVLGTKIDPDHDAVAVDGEAVAALDQFYVLLNKPKGCITAVTDDRGRPTVMDYLPNLPVPVKPVGRLDFYSEGVLLLTNDGELAARLLAPASHVAKTYHVKVHGHLDRSHLAALREGITLDDGATTLPAEVEVLPGESKHTWLGITIHEGQHRQIHRMIEALGYRVDKLQRVAFANLTFHNLRVGDARELTQQELNELRDLVGLDHSAVARGRWRAQREATDIPRRARAKALAEQEATSLSAGPDGTDEIDPRASGERTGGERTGGERSTGKRGTWERSGGERSAGERSTGKRGSWERSGGERSAGERSTGKRGSWERSGG